MVGFRHVFNIPVSLGREIGIIDIAGNWTFRRDTVTTPTSVADTSEFGRRCPLFSATSNTPPIGGRLSILGDLPCFRDVGIDDGDFANDAVWRASPLFLLRSFVRCVLEHTNLTHDGYASAPGRPSNSPHTGVRDSHQIQRSSVALQARKIHPNLKRL